MHSTLRNRPVYQVFGALAVAFLAFLTWYAWLGWDSRYQVDPVTGMATGPYQSWQVAGCVASLLVLLLSALGIGVRPFVASAALTLTFTTAWTVQAAADDETGLYGVGTLLLLGGLSAGCTLAVAVTKMFRRRHPDAH